MVRVIAKSNTVMKVNVMPLIKEYISTTDAEEEVSMLQRHVMRIGSVK